MRKSRRTRRSEVRCDARDDIEPIAAEEHRGFAFSEEAQKQFDGEKDREGDVEDFEDVGALGEEDLCEQ